MHDEQVGLLVVTVLGDHEQRWGDLTLIGVSPYLCELCFHSRILFVKQKFFMEFLSIDLIA